MEHFAPHYFLPIAILFLLTPRSFGDTQSLIVKICHQTSDFGFCQNTFNKHLFNPETDTKGLSQIAVTQTLIHATNTKIFISKAIRSEKDVELQNLYKICEVGYENLVGQFTDANFAFGRGDIRSMLFYVGKCERFVTDCQYVMGNQAPQLDVQNAQNRVLVQMSLFSGQLIG
ncbi:hypothetical protein PHJA_002771900 [Phtheirospermum japonicum]|uniref:Pectinesterase inhibitor domain-containing protein n=1 Tax=Phtheirospermum japonicum TaxID=374723 RepID=A0A830D943_9LAMI|nr:hypothetical protein PHJA_002771900 [Phtheirospermum japonicum]